MVSVIIPLSKQDYKHGISAPLQWLIPQIRYNVIGIFSDDNNIDHFVNNSKVIIIELNWFTEFFEVIEIITYIKQRNKYCKIIIGGLFASYHYKLLLKYFEIDYFIKGDNEYALPKLVDSIISNKSTDIPNVVGRDFENSIESIFSIEDYHNLKFSIDWIPTYKSRIITETLNTIDESSFSSPMFINSKSGCLCDHRTKLCKEACHGGNSIKKYYNRGPIPLTSKEYNHFISSYESIDSYDHISFIDTNENFDWENIDYIDKSVMIEMDSKITPEKLKVIAGKFRYIHSIICGSGNSMLDSDISRREKEIQEIIQIAESDNRIHNIDFYQHRDYSESTITEVEKKYPNYFRYSNYWTSDSKHFNIQNLYEYVSDSRNLKEIYELSKKITLDSTRKNA